MSLVQPEFSGHLVAGQRVALFELYGATGIAQLAYLLHDLGKVDTVGETKATVSEKDTGHTLQTFVRLRGK